MIMYLEINILITYLKFYLDDTIILRYRDNSKFEYSFFS